MVHDFGALLGANKNVRLVNCVDFFLPNPTRRRKKKLSVFQRLAINSQSLPAEEPTQLRMVNLVANPTGEASILQAHHANSTTLPTLHLVCPTSTAIGPFQPATATVMPYVNFIDKPGLHLLSVHVWSYFRV